MAAYTPNEWVTGELITAEDLNRLEQAVAETSATVDKIKLANQSAGEGAPSGTAPVGWIYTDLATGDVYRMEA